MTDKIREPKVKAGDTVKDYNGYKYTVLIISNDFQEVSRYDSGAMYLDIKTIDQLEDEGINPDDLLYCAVENEFGKPLVFPITRDSRILGE